MDDLHAVAPCLVEDEPVLETLHRPATEAAGCLFTETAQHSHSRHARQILKADYELVKKALGRFQPGLFLQVIKLRIDFAPRRSEEHTSELQSLRHLVCR